MDKSASSSGDYKDNIWWKYFLQLIQSLQNEAKQRWSVSDTLAEELAEKVLDQPSISEMQAGKRPKTFLKRGLLSRRLGQEYSRRSTNIPRGESELQEETTLLQTNFTDPTSDEAVKRCIATAIRDTLKKLPDVERRVFVLRVVVGRSFEQIGHVHGKSHQWARDTYALAVKHLRELLT